MQDNTDCPASKGNNKTVGGKDKKRKYSCSNSAGFTAKKRRIPTCFSLMIAYSPSRYAKVWLTFNGQR